MRFLTHHFLPTLLCAVALLQGQARAQSAELTFARNSAAVNVQPATADIGVARTIQVSGHWINGCAPVSARATQFPVNGVPVVTLELQEPLTLIACTQAITPYTLSASFTPVARGRLRIVVVSSSGQFLGEGLLDVRQAGDMHSRHDVTGVWYDPTTNGSGLTFIHSRTTDSLVFGTWYVYGTDGVARWFTIQSTRWLSQGNVLEGDLYETRAGPASCPPLSACPVPFSSVQVIGKARMTMNGAHAARIEAIHPGGAVMFASDVQRIQF
ncbi:MAG: hypothetical protein JNK75_15250 [Betaproteobacteria bacterium]|nr:hypothetical protein [Betaproteobacteria bacterium]